MIDISNFDHIGRAFEIDNGDMLPEYVKRFTSPMSADAEVSFKCDIDASLFAKLIGIDLANGQDATCASMIFQKPYQVQRKHHKKKRINKKWLKRYGVVTKYERKKCKKIDVTYQTIIDFCYENGYPLPDEIRDMSL